MGPLKPATRWFKSRWNEVDVWFFFETDEDGWVLRQIELRGPDQVPTVGASLAEWPDAGGDGLDAVQAYESKYGALADAPTSEWDADFPSIPIEHGEFERMWSRARVHLEGAR